MKDKKSKRQIKYQKRLKAIAHIKNKIFLSL